MKGYGTVSTGNVEDPAKLARTNVFTSEDPIKIH